MGKSNWKTLMIKYRLKLLAGTSDAAGRDLNKCQKPFRQLQKTLTFAHMPPNHYPSNPLSKCILHSESPQLGAVSCTR